MHSTASPSRERFAAQSSEADDLLDRMSRPALAEMAVWSGAAAGNDTEKPRTDGRFQPAARSTWRIVDTAGERAANVDDPLDPWPSQALYREARERRAQAIAGLVREGVRAAREALVDAWQRHQRSRHTRAIYVALSDLDDRTLRDLGFHRSEIGSVAAEASGEAESTRILARAPR